MTPHIYFFRQAVANFPPHPDFEGISTSPKIIIL